MKNSKLSLTHQKNILQNKKSEMLSEFRHENNYLL